MKPVRSLLSVAVTVALVATPLALTGGTAAQAAASTPAYGTSGHAHINCAYASGLCAEVQNSYGVFGHYVGHDEPSALFYSNTPGSGSHLRYTLTLPTAPSARHANAVNKSYPFELSGAEWLGMAMCATQSYPEQVKTCPAGSDRNILDPAVSPKHVGQAYTELQFYPPGWVPWPTWQVAVGASSCNPTEWCAALNIDSLALNPVNGKTLNPACLAKVGEEYVNFAFVTKNGKAQAPANPVDATTKTFTPSSRDLYMNSGDRVRVTMTDTRNGLKVILHDLTTGGTGSMTASAGNGFAQVKYAPTGTSCTALPYNFHPLYSTSSTKTRVTWAAGSYNIAFDTEIGHFQFCTGPKKIPATPFGLLPNGNPTTCPTGNMEGRGASASAPDADDLFCFPGSEALVFKVNGCSYTNTGFDGASYQKLWPDGNLQDHPAPFQFTSPTTGPGYRQQYQQAALETDLPAIESTCNPATGAGCTLIPQTDQKQPAAFYPFYSITKTSHGCVWQFGNSIPGQITDFGGNTGYGSLLALSYTQQGGGSANLYQDFRSIMSSNPCPAG